MVLFVERVGVIGAGTMGAAIAEVMALNGKQVVLRDLSQDLVDKGLRIIDGLLEDLVRFHARKADQEIERIEALGLKLTDDQKAQVSKARKPTYSSERAREARARVQGSTDSKDLAQCDVIIEAVIEDFGVKRKVFRDLDRHAPRHAILATNTSGLSVTEIAASTSRPQKVVGMHFFNPPTTLPLVEIIPGQQTSDDTAEDATSFVQELRNHRYPMQPVRVKECPGFLVNRILGRMLQEAYACLEEGIASKRDIDLAMKAGAGMPMGPLELSDLVGLDVIAHLTRHMKEAGALGAQREVRIVEQLVKEGKLGRKAGAGFYDYS